MQEASTPWQDARQYWTKRDGTGRIVGFAHCTPAAAARWAASLGEGWTLWQDGETQTADR